MRQAKPFEIRAAVPSDIPAMCALWNDCVAEGEVVYSPLREATFEKKLMNPGGVLLAAQGAHGLLGFVHGMTEPFEATGYLTVIFVAWQARRQGVGSALLSALEERMREELGKQVLACSGHNPVKLSWQIPGTPGHDHNNAPGVDQDCAGFPFLKARGFEAHFGEVAMYRTLEGYQWPKKMDEIRQRLLDEGIVVGPYDGVSTLEWDRMCDRVGSDYWRHVLRTELAAWKEGLPNEDASLWVDDTPPKGPRPLLLALDQQHIVGFTGPVDVQRSGRGWFTGICVDPQYERRSIGALLFHMLLRAFVTEGATFSTLFTGTENHAQQIYLRAGFSVARRFAVMTRPLEAGAAYANKHF